MDIPLLPDDPAVLKGVTPNGMSYYIVSNSSERGMADFALVQNTGRLTAGEKEAVEAAESAFSSLRRMKKPAEYLNRHEIIPGRRGFVELTDDATVYRFSAVTLGDSAVDSTLLFIMDIADRANYAEDEHITKWYQPSDQAVIVAGDVDTKSIEQKLRNMSFMLPAGKSEPRPEYVRKGDDGIIRKISSGKSLSEVSLTLTSKRPPKEYMNTIQTEIFGMSLNILGETAVRRIRKELKTRNIAFSDISYRHLCASTYPYDDRFTISASVAEENAGTVQEIIGGVMASIDAEGAGLDEYLLAESEYLLSLEDEAVNPLKSNGEYVDRCIHAFLYNSPLASAGERHAFHKSRHVPDMTRLGFFNDIAGALMDIPVAEPLTVERKEPVNISVEENESVEQVKKEKVKLRSSRKEPVSGGTIWTFSNGMKVIYKKMASERTYYSLAMNGGYANIEGLEPGEGAFVADWFKTCRIGGRSAEEFANDLKLRRMTMDVAVSMSNMIVSGHLPSDRMDMLLPALLALANERTTDETEYGYWRDCEYLALDRARGSLYTRMAAVDSLMCPDYKYSPYKAKGKMTEGFGRKAAAFYDRQFSKMNDAVLIIVGDVAEDKLKRQLQEAIVDFSVREGVFRKPVLRYQPVSGCSTYIVEGDSDNIDLVLSARLPLTMDNYMAANVAAMMMKRKLAEPSDDKGLYMDMSYNCTIYPEERFNMLLSVSEMASETGRTAFEMLADVRRTLAGVYEMKLTEDELKPYKERLKGLMEHGMKSPDYWVHAISLRYLDGKDLSTNYAARIDAVTPEKVMSVISLLESASKIEYVTSKR